MKTALASDEPPEPQPSFATGGIVPAGSTYVMPSCGEHVLPADVRTVTANTAGMVHRVIEILRDGEWVDVTEYRKPAAE